MNEEQNVREVTKSQLIDAQNYLRGYFKFVSMQYPYDMPETDEEVEQARKTWPKDAVAALDTIDAYVKQMDEAGIIV